MHHEVVTPTMCRLIRLKEVLNISGLSRTSLYRSVGRNDFPAPVQLSARAVAWRHGEVIAWVESRRKRMPPPK